MKLLHIADLHLGKRVCEYPMLEDQRVILREICDIAREECVDAVLIAGDVYDRPVPPQEASAMLSDFLCELSEAKISVCMIAGNHEQFTHEDWRALVGNERQGALSVGKYTFLMMDNFAEDLGPVYDSSDKYTQMDVDFIRAQLDAHPDHEFYLVSHYFSMEKESEAFRTLVATEPRIRGLFMGHTHLNTVIALGEDYAGKVIAQTGNFSYTCGDVHRDFWGFRDLVIAPDGTAISSYIIPESTIHPGGNTLTIQAKTVDVVAM